MTSAAVRGIACAAVLALLPVAAARASVVEHGYLPLRDGTMLSYTLTFPKAEGRFPVVLQYVPADSLDVPERRRRRPGASA
jgi:predicted acyl esterase